MTRRNRLGDFAAEAVHNSRQSDIQILLILDVVFSARSRQSPSLARVVSSVAVVANRFLVVERLYVFTANLSQGEQRRYSDGEQEVSQAQDRCQRKRTLPQRARPLCNFVMSAFL